MTPDEITARLRPLLKFLASIFIGLAVIYVCATIDDFVLNNEKLSAGLGAVMVFGGGITTLALGALGVALLWI